MAKRYYSEQYKETGNPNRPPIGQHIKTDARPDVDGTPDGPAEGPAKDGASDPTGPAAK